MQQFVLPSSPIQGQSTGPAFHTEIRPILSGLEWHGLYTIGMTDADLLRQHRVGDRQAFAELIRRHLGWVYGVARRRLKDASLAEDVAQAVFMLLHHKAPNFVSDSAMIGWMHTTTWRASKAAARGEQRRRKRETVFAQQRPKTTSLADHLDGPECQELAAMLDELIERLPRADAQAVLLRYLKEMSFSEIAAIMEISAEAARKRVERAVGKLQLMAVERRIAASPAQINTQVASHMRAAPPAGLTAVTAFGIADRDAHTVSASVNSIIKGVQYMGMTKTAMVVFSTLLCALVASTAWQMMPAGVVPQAHVSAAPPATQPRAETQQRAVEVISSLGEPLRISNVPRTDLVNTQAPPNIAQPAPRPPIVTSTISGEVVRLDGDDVIVNVTVWRPQVATAEMTLLGREITRLSIDLTQRSVRDLKPGMRLQAILSQGTEAQAAGFTVIASSPALTGEVVSVDPHSSVVTLIRSDAESTRVAVVTNENTKVVLFTEVEGSPGLFTARSGTISELKPGMDVSVVPPTGIATSITMRPRTGPPARNGR